MSTQDELQAQPTIHIYRAITLAMSGPSHHSGASASDQSRQHNGHVYHGPVYMNNNIPQDVRPQIFHSPAPSYGRHRPRPIGDPIHQEFISAAAEGRLPARLSYFFDDGADVDAKDDRGLTALHHASFNGHTEVVEALLREHANPNPTDATFGTPLCLAAVRGHDDIVSKLLDNGANNRAPAGLLGSPLHCAAASGSKRTFRLLLRRGNGSMSFKAATCLDLLDGIMDDERQWLANVFLRPQGPDYEFEILDSSPMAIAVRHGGLELTKLCLQEGTDVNETAEHWVQNSDRPLSPGNANASQAERSVTLLMLCCEGAPLEVLGLLLDSGASPHLRDNRGNSAMHYLAAYRDDPFLQPFLSNLRAAGADVNASNLMGETALHWFAEDGSRSDVRILLDANADISARDKNGWNALFYAIRRNRPRMIGFLCSKGINVNDTDRTGESALMLACRTGSKECIGPLIDAGALPNIRDHRGRTALMLADEKGNTACATLLRQLCPQLQGSHRNHPGEEDPSQ
ncbi:hypothetical protein Q7P37_000976 [Cladosporium fusiforme]